MTIGEENAALIITKFCRRKCGVKTRLGYWLSSIKIYNEMTRLSNSVYYELGWGWREDVYREALAYELRQANHLVEAEVTSPIVYKDRPLQYVNFRIDLLVDRDTVLELKACTGDGRTIIKAHQQCLRYLKMKKLGFGMVIIFPEKEVKRVYSSMVINYSLLDKWVFRHPCPYTLP
jgi:GxxExxY protein